MISPMKERDSGRSVDKEKQSLNSFEANTPQRKESILELYNKELSNQSKPSETGNKTKVNTVVEAFPINKEQISLSN